MQHPTKLILDLDSTVVDVVTEWQKVGFVTQFEIAGKTRKEIREWTEDLYSKGGELKAKYFDKRDVELNLSDNAIGDETRGSQIVFKQLEDLSKALKQDTTVTTLRLTNNQLGNTGVDWIAGALMKNDKLTELVLSSNNVSDEGVEGISAVLTKNRQLRKIDLSYNAVGPRGTMLLAESLLRNRSLVELDLSFNGGIGNEGCEALAQVLEGGESALKIIYLGGNRVSGRGLERLNQAFKRSSLDLVLHLGERSLRKRPAEEPDPDTEDVVVSCSTSGVSIGGAASKCNINMEQDEEEIEVAFRQNSIRKVDQKTARVQFLRQKLNIQIKGKELISVDLWARIQPGHCTWALNDGLLIVRLRKEDPGEWPQLTVD